MTLTYAAAGFARCGLPCALPVPPSTPDDSETHLSVAGRVAQTAQGLPGEAEVTT